MDRGLAIDILKALTCCTIHQLSCHECPLYDMETGICRPWTDEEVIDAVRTLNSTCNHLNETNI